MPTTLHHAAEQVRTDKVSPVDLLDACLRRIDRLEDRVHAWVFVDRESARAVAEERTEELRRGINRGPLHGIPIAIKDIFDVFDWPTAAGSHLWTQSIARQDATTVRKLREAGAVFIGKTVTTQYASFDPAVTRNPWDHDRTPGGSSSGSAAAVACGMCLGALGSQTGGSITRPASYCGVAAMKPTYGRVSLAGAVPLAHSMDHPGPFATCVRDVAILMQVLAGFDPLDPVSVNRPVPDYVVGLNRSTPPRLGRLRGLFEERADDAARGMMEDAVKRLCDRGATVVEVALPASFSEVIARHRTVMAVEALAFHEQRLKKHPEDYGPRIRSLFEDAIRCSAAEFSRTKEHQRRATEEIGRCFAGVDALLSPAATGVAPSIATTGDPAMNSPWSYVGLPTVTFPAAWVEGLPIGLQIAGPPWSEADLLATAAWCEEAIGCEAREVAGGEV